MTLKCATFGCQTLPHKTGGGVFCLKDWKRIPPALQTVATREGIAAAVAYLGKLDGYLIDAAPKRAVITEQGQGREYV
jgi:hypothetical protein